MINFSSLAQLGYSIVPTGTDKWPVVPSWKKYQEQIATPEELASWSDHYGVAVVCGQVSGNLEVIDFDLKNDLTGTLFDDFMQMVVDLMPEIAGSLVIAESRNKGRHVYYKCFQIDGNHKLASRPADEQELRQNPHLKLYGLIETRGEGGIIVCHPTPGYSWLQGDLSSVPVIQEAQRDELLNIARSFNSFISPPDPLHYPAPPPQESGYSLTPWADYNQRGDILSILQKHGYTILKQQGDNVRLRRPGKALSISGDFNVVKRWFTLFTTSTQFEAQKAYTPAAVLCKLEHNDDWTKLYQRLKDEGYGIKIPDIPKEVIRALNKGEASPEEVATYQEQYEKSKGPTIAKFWYRTMDKAGNIIVEIDRLKLRSFLKELGFFLFYHDHESPSFDIVKVQDKMVSYASETDMIHDLIQYVNGLPDRFDSIGKDDLMKLLSIRIPLIHEQRNIKFNLEKLHRQGWQFLKDTKDTCYLPYLNCVVAVKASGVQKLDYAQVDKLIWRKSVIKRTIDLLEDFSAECEYSRFINCISKDIDPEIWHQRELSAFSIIGYLLHGYKDRIRPKAIILMEQCDDPVNGGGTGKGIFIQGLSAMVKTVLKTGKSFDPNSTFAFQDITPYTRILNISDPGRRFRIEDYNNIITDAIKTERKNRDAVTLLYEESPKIVIDMNYTITEMEESALRRIETFEFSPYFGRIHTPALEFGHALFWDWEPEEYNRFDNFMVACIRLHLAEGFIRIPISEGGKIKTMKQRWGEGFADWFREWIKSDASKSPTKFSILYDQFTEEYHNDSKPYSKDSFSRAINFCTKLYGLTLNEKRLYEAKRPKAYWIGDAKVEEELPF